MAAPRLASGFPSGRALCAKCLQFVGLSVDGALVAHDTWDETAAEAADRAEWFNAFGWADDPRAEDSQP